MVMFSNFQFLLYAVPKQQIIINVCTPVKNSFHIVNRHRQIHNRGLQVFKQSQIQLNNMKTLRRIEIVKSPEDGRNYRGLELLNRLKVLLVSDPLTDKSAAALDVNVGYMSDPDEIPGLAHFCEHMLFLGTKKYPIENEYTKFLSEHGGSSNACTFSDHTKYFFDVVPSHLESALDRFAQFFIDPMFTEDATDRELNAVNLEHEKNISSDTWRLDQLDKHTADPTHPYSKFGTGNKDTLDTIPKEKTINVRNELLTFHSKWYSSNIMSLAVLGREPSLHALILHISPILGPIICRFIAYTVLGGPESNVVLFTLNSKK